ncbi:DUF3558 domain-containing protein [Solihabitans fulvus]|uniref:DUF3558 domain-containing protein n=1 Tax=Solihabitans fulvus TaxID=1892852 RepID=A0A5B2XEX3_9PSEU|nr:DUF3558 family protein [Solihabitans fulvus]KAA2261605.1 DUF3558 domain-containing protein [Solihabitans fulvus]
MKRLVVLAGLLGATLLAAAGCGESVAPSASPSSSAPSSAGKDTPLDSRDPCSLLSQSEAASAGATSQPQRKKVGTADSCLFSAKDLSMIVGIQANVGLAGLQPNGRRITDTKVGGHEAKLAADGLGNCLIAIGVSGSSRVDVAVTGGGKVDPCPVAVQVAQLVEPKLR